MTVGFILQFEGIDESHYQAVNEKLGLDPHTGAGDWPPGLLGHTAGHAANGGLVVAELWESADAQGRFMESRLGPALAEVGVPDPTSVTVFEVLASHTP